MENIRKIYQKISEIFFQFFKNWKIIFINSSFGQIESSSMRSTNFQTNEIPKWKKKLDRLRLRGRLSPLVRAALPCGGGGAATCAPQFSLSADAGRVRGKIARQIGHSKDKFLSPPPKAEKWLKNSANLLKVTCSLISLNTNLKNYQIMRSSYVKSCFVSRQIFHF